MARANRRRLFRLPRGADQQPGAERVSIPHPRCLASAVMSAQPKSKSQTPEVGAECPNWARSDLCGGRSAMGVPTANRIRFVYNVHDRILLSKGEPPQTLVRGDGGT